MCGIAGKISFTDKSVQIEDLEALKTNISHRGTDDEGIYLSPDQKLGLVHTRLSIMDLSHKGHQPMSFLDRYQITFNGEIYNFKDLKNIPEVKKLQFKSDTDTEVIMALYHLYQEKCLDLLRGMFAFAIYDRQTNSLFIARDRIGKKPLKYYFDSRVFIFASENRALVTQPEVTRSPDYSSLNDYLIYGYIPSPDTGFTNLYKLEQAHYLLINLKTHKLINKRYWHLDFQETLDRSEKYLTKEIVSRFSESVQLRLISDVPVGALLSGGVDSSLIVAQMSKLGQKNIHTFSIAFKEKLYNESHYAQSVSDIFHTQHHEVKVDSKSLTNLSELIYHCGEPTADASIVITDIICKSAREYVKVVLNGDCGDEAFGGYDRYRRLKRDLTLFPHGVNLPLPKSIRSVPKIARFLQNQSFPFPERFARMYGFFNSEDLDIIIRKPARKKYFFSEPYQTIISKFSEAKTNNILRQSFYFDIMVYFPDDLLAKADLIGMRHNLEQRSPFIDHKLLELAAILPDNLKISEFGEAKYLLKKIALSYGIPKENIYRPKKGFGIPLREWLLENDKQLVREKLLDKKSLPWDIFDKSAVKSLISAYNLSNDLAPKLWNLLVYSLWWQNYFY